MPAAASNANAVPGAVGPIIATRAPRECERWIGRLGDVYACATDTSGARLVVLRSIAHRPRVRRAKQAEAEGRDRQKVHAPHTPLRWYASCERT